MQQFDVALTLLCKIKMKNPQKKAGNNDIPMLVATQFQFVCRTFFNNTKQQENLCFF